MSLFGLLMMALWVAARAGAQDGTFRAVDLYVDSGTRPLAAYQLNFHSSDANVKIVGIEGGEHSAFSQPPYYDPLAMQSNRVIIAAFSAATADQLPHGRTRVATIHLQIPAHGKPEYQLKPAAAAAPSAERINVKVEAKERAGL